MKQNKQNITSLHCLQKDEVLQQISQPCEVRWDESRFKSKTNAQIAKKKFLFICFLNKNFIKIKNGIFFFCSNNSQIVGYIQWSFFQA